MNAEKLKAETIGFLDKEITTVKCCGKVYTITGMCVAVSSILIILHVMIAKCVCGKISKLKSKIKSLEEKA